jgi:hypothetical protein
MQTREGLVKDWLNKVQDGWRDMNNMRMLKDRRTTDTFFDRRSGNDRRAGYESGYFSQGGLQRRKGLERRQKFERRDQYVRINKWSSICANPKSFGE